MKDQYTGDINDYCKYGLLRALSAGKSGQLAMCWMLTAPDDRTDGIRTGYLDAPEAYRSFDPSLFDALNALVATGSRSVNAVQAANVLPAARFHSDLLPDGLDARNEYFDAFLGALGAWDLAFFDPDNGLEVPSVRKGHRNSSKYLYWDELARALGRDRTVCVYQHFPRRPRTSFLNELLEKMIGLSPGHAAFAITSPWVAYLICAPQKSIDDLRRAGTELVGRPGSPLSIVAST